MDDTRNDYANSRWAFQYRSTSLWLNLRITWYKNRETKLHQVMLQEYIEGEWITTFRVINVDLYTAQETWNRLHFWRSELTP